MTPEAAAWRHRELSTRCTTCAAVPGQPCRLIGVGASLYRPHRERLLAAIFEVASELRRVPRI